MRCGMSQLVSRDDRIKKRDTRTENFERKRGTMLIVF